MHAGVDGGPSQPGGASGCPQAPRAPLWLRCAAPQPAGRDGRMHGLPAGRPRGTAGARRQPGVPSLPLWHLYALYEHVVRWEVMAVPMPFCVPEDVPVE